MRKLILPLLLLALAVLVAREIRYYLESRARLLAYERWRIWMLPEYEEILNVVATMPRITLEDKEHRAVVFVRRMQELREEEEEED